MEDCTRTAEDTERWRTGGGFLPAAVGHSLDKNRTDSNMKWIVMVVRFCCLFCFVM